MVVDREADSNTTGGTAPRVTAASDAVKRTIRRSVPKRYRTAFDRAMSAAGTVLALLALLFAGYVLLRTVYYVIGPLVGVEVLPYQYTNSSRILQFVVLALAWDLVGGQAGYPSFGNIAFFGIGAYVVGILLNGTVGWLGTHGFLTAFVAAGLVSLVYALVVGYPVLRLRGHYFAVATLGLLVATQQYLANMTEAGGGSGLTLPPPPFENVNRAFFLLFAGLTVVTLLVYWYLTTARFGYGLNAIRDDEGKARAMGIHTTLYKQLAWGVSGLLTGLAGAVFAYQNAYIAPTVALNVDWTVFMILMALVGGIGRLWGPVVGAALLWEIRNVLWGNGPMVQAASEFTGLPFSEAYLVVFGLVLVGFVLLAPEGLLGYLDDAGVFDSVRRRLDATPAGRDVFSGSGGDS